jgi:metal-dependent hydrolase (beta-lactamase superfamily II)
MSPEAQRSVSLCFTPPKRAVRTRRQLSATTRANSAVSESVLRTNRASATSRAAPFPVFSLISDQAFTTGVIPLNSFERAAIPTEMRPGVGCDRALLDPSKRSATQIADDGEHELATCYAVKGLGLVVIASCSHRGVLNSVRRAQAVSGISKVHAVVGGFHLVRPRTDELYSFTPVEKVLGIRFNAELASD